MGEVFALFVYGGVLREILQRWKYDSDALAGKALCGWMREETAARGLSLDVYDAILPVPLSLARLRRRGFHPAWMLTRSLKPLTKRPMYPMLLRRKHEEGHQAGRSRVERLQSLQGLISVAPWAASSLKGARLLLVDDVFTTGATLQECSLALLQAGAAQVDALCLCRAL
jgi:ComF family protein